MQRPDNYGLLMALLFAGWIFGLACVIVSHRLARLLGKSNKPVALRISVPTVLFLLNIVLLIAIPMIITVAITAISFRLAKSPAPSETRANI